MTCVPNAVPEYVLGIDIDDDSVPFGAAHKFDCRRIAFARVRAIVHVHSLDCPTELGEFNPDFSASVHNTFVALAKEVCDGLRLDSLAYSDREDIWKVAAQCLARGY